MCLEGRRPSLWRFTILTQEQLYFYASENIPWKMHASDNLANMSDLHFTASLKAIFGIPSRLETLSSLILLQVSNSCSMVNTGMVVRFRDLWKVSVALLLLGNSRWMKSGHVVGRDSTSESPHNNYLSIPLCCRGFSASYFCGLPWMHDLFVPDRSYQLPSE